MSIQRFRDAAPFNPYSTLLPTVYYGSTYGMETSQSLDYVPLMREACLGCTLGQMERLRLGESCQERTHRILRRVL